MLSKRSKAAVQLVSTIAVVALATVLAKDSLASVHYFSFVWLQMLIASLFMIGLLAYTEQFNLTKITIKLWLMVIAIGLLNFAIVRAIFIYTLDLLPATTHAYIINFVGIVTTILSALMLREPPSLQQIIGSLVAVAGVRLYFWELPMEGELEGILWLLVAIVCLALTNILMRKIHEVNDNQITNNQIASLAILTGSVPLVLWGVVFGEDISSIQVKDWGVIVLNGLISICLVMVVFNYVLKVLKAFEASILATSGVVFTAVFSSILLGEEIDAFELSGIGVMILGILLVQKRTIND